MTGGKKYSLEIRGSNSYSAYCLLLIVRLFNLHENIWLRLLNGVIVGYGIYASIRFKRLILRDRFDYYAGATTGIFTGFIATLIFVGFMGVYMFHLDPAFPKKS